MGPGVSGTRKPDRRPKPGQPKPGPRGRPRTGARVAAVQALYQSEQSGEAAETVIDQFVRHRIGNLPDRTGHPSAGFEDGQVPEADVPLFARIVRATALNAETVDGIVAGHLGVGWPMMRLDPVLRALLRAACTELRHGSEPPARVVINEYLDIAHGFLGGEEPRFANGVLDAMARSLRADEFAAVVQPAG